MICCGGECLVTVNKSGGSGSETRVSRWGDGWWWWCTFLSKCEVLTGGGGLEDTRRERVCVGGDAGGEPGVGEGMLPEHSAA